MNLKNYGDYVKKGYSAVSLFSGAGGMDVGFSDAGFDIEFANDIDKAACMTYDLNHKSKCLWGDLRDHEDTLSKFKGADLVFGGPPCQGFSVAGKMDPMDERSELIWSFFDKVDLLRPTAFVCENVKALAVNNRWRLIRDGLINKASRLGYTTSLVILNASEFGVPQARERMFIVGVKKTRKEVDLDAFKAALESSLELKKNSPCTVADIIRKLGPAGNEKNNRTCSAIITYAKNPVLRRSPYAGMLFNGAGRPINSSGVALTLPASMGGNKTPIIDENEIFKEKPSYVVRYHEKLIRGNKPKIGLAPSYLRRITIDEALALQTFPTSYHMAGSQSAMYRQIGNAVPCHLAEVVGQCIIEVLDMGIEKFISHFNPSNSPLTVDSTIATQHINIASSEHKNQPIQ